MLLTEVVQPLSPKKSTIVEMSSLCPVVIFIKPLATHMNEMQTISRMEINHVFYPHDLNVQRL